MARMSDDGHAPAGGASPAMRTSHGAEFDFPLFVDVTTITIDPAYLEAAGRHAAESEDARPSAWRGRITLPAALLALGALLSASYRQTQLTEPATNRARAALVAEAQRRTQRTDDLQRQEEVLREAADAARERRLRTTSTGRALAERLHRLELSVGAVGVTGPAVEVLLSDAGDDRAEDLAGEGTIRDRDIQDVVNALWAAGAEAIAINGQRLGPLTAIREAGEAVLVDYRPVTPPYRIQAVGDQDEVETRFTESSTAGAFRTLAELYGIGFEVRRRDRVTLRAAAPRIRVAAVPS